MATHGPARASGYPSYASDSNSAFIPEVWSGRLTTKFYATTVFGEIANTDYEGEISDQGDKVMIRTRPSITVRKYKIGQGLSYETPTSDHVSLNIDQGDYFGFKLNDVDAYQSDINLMNEFTDDATEQMQAAIDTQILSTIPADVDPANTGATAGVKTGRYDMGSAGSAVELTKKDNPSSGVNVLDWLVNVGTVLDEQNVPQSGRWIVIPPWVAGMIKKSDLANASFAGDETSIIRNGRIGMINGMTLYNSNNLNMTGSGSTLETDVVAGHKAALTFASQMTQVDNIDNPNDFGKLVRGLNVWGAKVIGPKYMVHSVISPK